MVCISAGGDGHFIKLDGIMIADKYCQNWFNFQAIPSGKCLTDNTFTFSYDKDLKDTAKKHT